VLVGAGDIAVCGATGAVQTGDLLDTIEGTIFTAGDNAYPSGRMEDYMACYNPAWGRHKGRTRPVPGNHEYETVSGSGGIGYFNYFGELAGTSGQGYYTYMVGPWKVIALNSEIGVSAGSAQGAFLRNELTTNSPQNCTVAIWHRPLYTSGPNQPQNDMRDFFRLMFDNKGEIVISGHDHLYERFAPQNADGQRNDASGVRQFVVGTGGVPLYVFGAPRPNSETRIDKAHGVLKLTLSTGRYQWEFIAVGGAIMDSGTGTCH
jgi:hypothetical protein